ncbi:uncharacterized protein LOC128675017 [Plodia interpunctella]|uniref:uncharacterized protein LOC128675017 n=1 Tax=Plodia interpunctella TaxID=58824 RepID=UPI0023675C47|nr:uncharacterized protein LOC128675017 [Plodia interpunctella]XP_053610054.1 uncharacterized protein LOC128675017 [Plodia interpunctella]
MSNQRAPKPDPRRTQINSNANVKWKSDICINATNKGSYTIFKSSTGTNITDAKNRQKEYYKRYEHDELPVKDNNVSKGKSSILKITDNTNKSITNSDLDRLEQKLYKNLSQDLQIEHASATSLESNIKFFKSTIQEIFNTFQSNLRDYDVYKQKLNEILSRTQEESISDMENFIKDMIQNIISCESSFQSLVTNDNMVQVDNQVEVQDCETSTMQDDASKTDTLDSLKTFDTSYDESVQLIVEAYKNDNYLTDSTFNENNSKKNHTIDNRVNVYLLSTTPCIIKMNDRSLLSEINIKKNSEGASSYVASTENIKKLAAKKIEIEQYELQPQNISDREIPVKVSFAKKNLCGSDDRVEQDKEVEDCSKSFISKICNFLCKKLRRNSLT